MSSIAHEPSEEGPLFEAKTDAELVKLVMAHIREARLPIEEIVVVVLWKDGAHKGQIGTRANLLSELRERGAAKEIERELERPGMEGRLPIYEIDESAAGWGLNWVDPGGTP